MITRPARAGSRGQATSLDTTVVGLTFSPNRSADQHHQDRRGPAQRAIELSALDISLPSAATRAAATARVRVLLDGRARERRSVRCRLLALIKFRMYGLRVLVMDDRVDASRPGNSMSPYCPHCNDQLEGHDDSRAGRCPSCQLVIGAGRVRAEPTGESRPGGFMANAAKRAEAAPVDPSRARAALCEVAARLGCRVQRMRMTDYDLQTRTDPSLPSVAEVLATFPSWKSARADAGAALDQRRVAAANASDEFEEYG